MKMRTGMDVEKIWIYMGLMVFAATVRISRGAESDVDVLEDEEINTQDPDELEKHARELADKEEFV